MTKYTAEDFAKARFAIHEGGCAAVAHNDADNIDQRWSLDCSPSRRGDADMADESGWRIVRDAESLTAREHQEKAWEKAHETDVIPAGAEHIAKWDGGSIETYPHGLAHEMEARSDICERRLLDPPPAQAWHNARIIEVDECQWARREDLNRGVEWIALRGIPTRLTTAEITAYGDVTVVVGADDNQAKGQDR